MFSKSLITVFIQNRNFEMDTKWIQTDITTINSVFFLFSLKLLIRNCVEFENEKNQFLKDALVLKRNFPTIALIFKSPSGFRYQLA